MAHLRPVVAWPIPPKAEQSVARRIASLVAASAKTLVLAPEAFAAKIIVVAPPFVVLFSLGFPI